MKSQGLTLKLHLKLYVLSAGEVIGIPCALSAMSIAGIEAGSEKANAVSVVAVAVSSITTTVIIALGIVLMQPLTPVLNSAVLAPAFSNVVPAIFGALAGLWLLKEFKVSVVSVVLCL